MNNAAADSDIKDKCQQTEIDFSTGLLQICGLALCQNKLQLYKDQLRIKTYFLFTKKYSLL